MKTAIEASGAKPAAAGRLALDIGGVTIAIASTDRTLGLAPSETAARFAARDADSPDITVEASWSAGAATAGRLVFDSGGVWQLHEADGGQVFSCRSPKFGAQPYKTATVTSDFSAATIHLDRACFDGSQPQYPLEYPFDELIVINWLAQGRGVEVHACGVRDDETGNGYLFAGQSGAGKSTIARLWNESARATVLSDDRIILRRIGDEIWMYGTPWHGDAPLASPTCAVLTRGFFLWHEPANHISDVARAEATANLFARAFPPFFSAPALDFTVAFLGSVAGLVPFHDLGFTPDDRILSFVRNLA